MKEKKKTGYITVQYWMVEKLHLKGNELLTYALIYGFSQDGETAYKGSLSYITQWLGISERGVTYILDKLVDKGLLKKWQETVNGVKVNRYIAITDPQTPDENEPENPGSDPCKNCTHEKIAPVQNVQSDPCKNCSQTPAKIAPKKYIGKTKGNILPSCARGAQGGEPTPKDVFTEYADGDKLLLDALTKFDAYRSARRGKVWDAQAARAVCSKLTQLADEARTTKRSAYMIASIMQSIEAGWSVLDHPKSWGNVRTASRSARIVDRPEPSGNDFLQNAGHRRPLTQKHRS